MKSVVLPALALLLLLTACGDKPAEPPAASVAPVEIARSEAPADASVFFVSPQDGETVTNPIRVVFGIEGMSVVAAGTDTPHSGHHHLLIDTGLPDLGLPIP
jgi:predicted small lipoprotein YifL